MKRLIAAFALALAAACGAPAFAQIDKQGGPIEVRAEALEALTNDGRYIYTKNVDAVQGNARLKADKLTIICAKTAPDPKAAPGQRAANSCGEVQTLIAEGKVYYLTPDGKIVGDHAEYDYASKVITITGDVLLSRGDEGSIRGRKLIYEVEAGKATMTSENGQGVFSVFTQTKKPDSATPAPAPAATPPAAPGASH